MHVSAICIPLTLAPTPLRRRCPVSGELQRLSASAAAAAARSAGDTAPQPAATAGSADPAGGAAPAPSAVTAGTPRRSPSSPAAARSGARPAAGAQW